MGLGTHRGRRWWVGTAPGLGMGRGLLEISRKNPQEWWFPDGLNGQVVFLRSLVGGAEEGFLLGRGHSVPPVVITNIGLKYPTIIV